MDRRAANPQLAGDLRRSNAIRRQGPHLGSLGHGDGLATLGWARGRAFGVVLLLALKAYPGGAVYGGTKWFVRDFMEVLRMESAMEGTNIRTTTIYPAAINTELLVTISDKGTAEMMRNTYDKYGISPDRIANVVAFAIDQPEDTTINEFTMGPANQPW